MRRALHSFFTWLFPHISMVNTAPSLLDMNLYISSTLQHSLAPHSSTLLLFTTSGQTHIFPEIRIDAVRLLDLYLETFPDLVVCGWKDGKNGHGRRVLDGYLSLLNASTKLGEEGGKCSLTASLLRTDLPIKQMEALLLHLLLQGLLYRQLCEAFIFPRVFPPTNQFSISQNSSS